MMKPYVIHHLVKSGDLNHHGTLFAGRTAEWLVEAGFIAAASLTSPDSTVCLNIHGMIFRCPVRTGSLIRFESKVVYAGRTSLIAYIKVTLGEAEEHVVDGYITFVHVDKKGEAKPHGITIVAATPEEMELQERAKFLKSK